jgi:hypothetical protein
MRRKFTRRKRLRIAQVTTANLRRARRASCFNAVKHAGASRRGAGDSTWLGREDPASLALVNLGLRQCPHEFSARGAQSGLRNVLRLYAWPTAGLEMARGKLRIGLREAGHGEHHC